MKKKQKNRKNFLEKQIKKISRLGLKLDQYQCILGTKRVLYLVSVCSGTGNKAKCALLFLGPTMGGQQLMHIFDIPIYVRWWIIVME